jgi:hypothetical protein
MSCAMLSFIGKSLKDAVLFYNSLPKGTLRHVLNTGKKLTQCSEVREELTADQQFCVLCCYQHSRHIQVVRYRVFGASHYSSSKIERHL